MTNSAIAFWSFLEGFTQGGLFGWAKLPGGAERICEETTNIEESEFADLLRPFLQTAPVEAVPVEAVGPGELVFALSLNRGSVVSLNPESREAGKKIEGTVVPLSPGLKEHLDQLFEEVRLQAHAWTDPQSCTEVKVFGSLVVTKDAEGNVRLVRLTERNPAVQADISEAVRTTQQEHAR